MKDIVKQTNWEKVGVYIAAISLLVIFASKIVDLSERISKIEGKFEIIINYIELEIGKK